MTSSRSLGAAHVPFASGLGMFFLFDGEDSVALT